MESKDGMSAADILHVRAGQNYLVEDFTRMERLRSDPVVLESLSRVAQEIGFDRVRPYVMENGRYKAMPDMPFTQWENPYFTVDPPAQEQGDTFTIYQLKAGPETRDYRFEPYESLQKRGWPLTGRITILSTRPRWTARPRWRIFTAHSMPTAPPTSGATRFRFGCCRAEPWVARRKPITVTASALRPVPEFFLQRKNSLRHRNC